MKRLSLLFGSVLLLWGCGYYLPQRTNYLPSEVRTIYVELFANHTFEPYVENRITNAVVDWFDSKPGLTMIEDRSRADAVLSGVVTGYTSDPVSYGRGDDITEYRSTMTIAATLRQVSSGRVLWKGSLEWSEEYPATLNKTVQEDAEAAAIQVIAERLARELYDRMTANF